MVGAIVAIAVEEALKKENHQSLLIISVRSDFFYAQGTKYDDTGSHIGILRHNV